MNIKVIIFLSLFGVVRIFAQAELPEQITNFVTGKALREQRANSASEEETKIYLAENWRIIASNIHILPKIGAGSHSQTGVSDACVGIFAVACESLSPMDFLAYLDAMVGLYEKKEISDNAFESLILMQEEKCDFLSVNWEHPRVQAFLAKSRKLIPPDDVDLVNCVAAMASGELADGYMLDRADDDPRPQTLPGIKLKRPWDSLITKYERMTGKKIDEPYDSRLNPRPKKRNDLSRPERLATADSSTYLVFDTRFWALGGVFALGLILTGAFWIRSLRRRRA